jgi:predicted transport protein
MNSDKNIKIPKKTIIYSKYFKSKLNLDEILDISDSTDDIAIFVDENVLPEINDDDLNHVNYLEILNAGICLANYGKNNKLKKNELKSFVLIMIDLLYNNLSEAIASLTKKEIEARNKSIEFLNSLNNLEKMDESLKIRLLIDFVLNSHEKERELIKKSVMLTPEQINKINQVERKGFSAKVRFILDSYFIENKTLISEQDVISGVNSNIIEIYYKLKEKIIQWDDKIKFKPIRDYLTFSYYYRFLRINFDNDKMSLQLSFSDNKPFDDYKNITKEIETKTKRKKFNFSLNSYDDIDYALFLIKQSYENNNHDIYSYLAFNSDIHNLFNKIKRYNFPFNKIPQNGLFVMFEKGEKFRSTDKSINKAIDRNTDNNTNKAIDRNTDKSINKAIDRNTDNNTNKTTDRNIDRIVYVGSNIKKNRLPKMLNFIFKDGNRDNTIFRKNIGRALLRNNNNYFKKFNIKSTPNLIAMWDMDFKEFNEKYDNDSDESKEIGKVEEMVSQYIQDNFSFSLIKIEDKLKRSHLKSKIISSLSLSEESKPSKTWLGHDSTREKIRKSGLYLEQHLYNRENQLNNEDIEFLKEIAKE